MILDKPGWARSTSLSFLLKKNKGRVEANGHQGHRHDPRRLLARRQENAATPLHTMLLPLLNNPGR
jgi:hypothetical protein